MDYDRQVIFDVAIAAAMMAIAFLIGFLIAWGF